MTFSELILCQCGILGKECCIRVISMWVYDGSLSLHVSRCRCSLFTKHSYHHLNSDCGISSFKSIVTALCCIYIEGVSSINTEKNLNLKRTWSSWKSSDDDVNVTDNPEDAPRDDGEGGDDDDQDWGERGPGV